jgi:DNA topoisomerase-1
VNDYLREISGDDFTAKDFRTWAGTVLAAIALREFEAVTLRAHMKKNIIRAIEAVARVLGNTPTVCRKCYIHPEILESYLSGSTIAAIQQRAAGKIRRGFPHLSSAESAVLVLLQSRLKRRRNRP